MYLFDCSFGHAAMAPEKVKAAGAAGVILYAGCSDSRKNATKAEVQALLDDGFMVGLVIENGTQDMLGGKSRGVDYGRAVVAGARTVGYDLDHCVLFTAADWDTTSSQDAAVDAFMQGFRSVVPVPGLYGDRGALDYCAVRGHADVFWQTNAMGWSGGVTSSHAHLQQRYNDPRAHGLPVDVNDVCTEPLTLMGEVMAAVDLTPAALEALAKAVWDQPVPLSTNKAFLAKYGYSAESYPARSLLDDVSWRTRDNAQRLAAIAARELTPAQVKATVEAILPEFTAAVKAALPVGASGGLTEQQIQDATEVGMRAVLAQASLPPAAS